MPVFSINFVELKYNILSSNIHTSPVIVFLVIDCFHIIQVHEGDTGQTASYVHIHIIILYQFLFDLVVCMHCLSPTLSTF